LRRAVTCIVLSLAPGLGWAQGGPPLGPEFRVNTYTTHIQDAPSVAADGAGNFVVAWQSYLQAGAHFEVFAQRFAASGAPLGPEFRVNTLSGVVGDKFEPSVGSNALGNSVVAWTSWFQDGSVGGIFAQRFAPSGAPLGPEFQANTYINGNQISPAVAVGGDASFVIAWRSGDSWNYGIFGRRYAASGAPAGPEFRVNTYIAYSQDFPAVAADAAGNFVVVWQSAGQDGSYTGIFGQRFDASGIPLGPEFGVNSSTTGRQDNPRVAADAAGGFVVVWESDPAPGPRGVYARRFAASGAPLGPDFAVHSTSIPGTFPIMPTVAADPAGDFVVSWTSFDTSLRGCFARLFDASGAPLAPEFRVNTYTTSTQQYPVVAVGGLGAFVVAWQSYQDGNGNGVFAQRYGPILPVELMHVEVE